MHFELMALIELPSLNFLWSIIQMVIGIGLIIFVHELGHFLAAKACGVKCEKFYVGFDAFNVNLGVVTIPRRLAYFQWGETEYGIGILPLGGYVKMLGQHDNPVEAVTDPSAANASIQLANDGPKIDAQAAAAAAIDPRSFQAKTVPQRMLIMSAGVIMNMVSAVFFAAFAFGFGVSYQPAMVGDTIGGSPAWEKNLSGAEIIKINGMNTQERYFPFEDLASTVMVGGPNQEVLLEIKRPQTQGQIEILPPIKPVVGIFKLKGFNPPSLGIQPLLSCRLGAADPTSIGHPAHGSGLKPNDLIIKVNGLEVNDRVELGQQLTRSWDQPVTLTVLRDTKGIYFSWREYREAGATDGEQLEITVGTNPLKEMGFVPKYGPITAVQVDSPAYQEGLKAGDYIVSLDGNPFDPLLASQYLRKMARAEKPVEVKILRTEGEAVEELTINVVPQFPNGVFVLVASMPIAIDELGVALHVYNEIQAVDEAGPFANKLQVGDKILAATIDFRDPEMQKKAMQRNKNKLVSVDGEEIEKSWALVFEGFQSAYPSAFLKLKLLRGEQEIDVELEPVASDRYFSERRGISLQPVTRIYQAKDTADALNCGWRQVQYDSGRIFNILRQMVNGNVPMTALGGIGTIAIGATSEAMSGTPRLLMFLTMLSVNLAILNFLPIPILDGGHMVFLIWEGVTGRPPNERVQEALTMVGGLLLLGLIIFALGMDVWRIMDFI